MTALSGKFQTDLAPPDALVACARAIDGLGWRTESVERHRIVSYADSVSTRHPLRIEVVVSESGQATDLQISGADSPANPVPRDELIAELNRVRDAIRASIEGPSTEQPSPLARGPLFRERSPAAQVITGVVVPAVFGAVAGLVLGVSAAGYWALQVVALIGAFLAGLEHPNGREGAQRGLVGGTIYGGFILIAHELAGTEAEVELPDFAPVLIVFTALFGVLGGALGGRLRRGASEEP